MEKKKEVLRKIGEKEITKYATKLVYPFLLLSLYIINLSCNSSISLLFFVPLFLLSLLFSFLSIEGEMLEEKEKEEK